MRSTALMILLAGCAATDEPALRPVLEEPGPEGAVDELDAVFEKQLPASDDDDLVLTLVGPQPLVDRTLARGLDFSSPGWDEGELPAMVEDRANGGGGTLTDLDADGDLDLVLTAPRGGNAIFLNSGGSFERVAGAGIEELPGTSCVTALDLNGDRRPELLLGVRRELLLFGNLGSGRFELLGVLHTLPEGPSIEGVTAADVDGDGQVDLYVSAQGRHEPGELPGASWGAEDVLLRGLGEGAFEDVSMLAPAGTLGGQSFSATWLDVDQDGDLDLYSVKDRGTLLVPARLLVNPGSLDQPWTEESLAWGMALGGDGMGVSAGDIDGDGRIEVLQSDNWGRLPLLSVDAEMGSAIRVDQSWGLLPYDAEQQSTSWGQALEDFDNDGDLDALVVFGRIAHGGDARQQQTGLWLWDDDGFVGRPDLLDFAHPAPPDALRNPLVGDLNGDGALDVVLTAQTGEPVLLEGRPSGWHWLSVRLDGGPGNRDGLGAVVEVEAGGRTLRRLIQAGGQGVHGSGPALAWFGLGPADRVDRLSVRWPDGSLGEWSDLEVDERLVVEHP